MALSEFSQSTQAPDLAKELGVDGIRSLISLMCDAYIDLLNTNFVQKDTPEDVITEEWFVKIQNRYQNSNLAVIPVHQKQDISKGKRGKRSPTIDFCFRHSHFRESYFGAECKLLDERNSKLLSEYVGRNNGIGRFLDGRYSSNASAGAMVGYVRIGDPSQVAKRVAGKLLKLQHKSHMKKIKIIENYEYIYRSHHKRLSGLSPFQIYHVFYEFRLA